MICVVINGPTFEEAYRQISEALAYANCVELRFDRFYTIDSEDVQVLRSHFSIPMIFTLRSVEQGGDYKKSEVERLQDIDRLAALQPEYLDLETHIPVDKIHDIAAKHTQVRVILSYHDFNGIPDDLDVIHEKMKQIPATFYKVAVMVKSSVDTLRLMLWAKNRDDKLIVIAMGCYGQASRVLAPVLGFPLTYCSLDQEDNALGQLTSKILVDIYRYHRINRETSVYALIGDPIDQSLSHITHNALMQACGLNAIYIKMQVHSSELGLFLQLAKQFPFRGMSVTMPLKELVLPFLDEIDFEARDIGAVNTIVLRDGRWFGYNTDGVGALNAIESKYKVKDKRIALIGAGGSAKAVMYELLKCGAIVRVYNRDGEKALELAKKYGCSGSGLECIVNADKKQYDVLINCTPVDNPIPIESIIPHTVVMDIKTRARDTEFLKHARNIGCHIVYGYEMFIEQAIKQFELWFQDHIDEHTSRTTLHNHLIEDTSEY